MKIDGNNNCTKCLYSIEQELNNDLKKPIQCNFNPPQSLAIASPQGIQIMTVYPIVNEKMLCSQGEMKPYILN